MLFGRIVDSIQRGMTFTLTLPKQKLTIYLIKEGLEPHKLVQHQEDLVNFELITVAEARGLLYIKSGESKYQFGLASSPIKVPLADFADPCLMEKTRHQA